MFYYSLTLLIFYLLVLINTVLRFDLIFEFKIEKAALQVTATSYEIKYDVIVVDEVSMLPKSLWDLLISHNAYVIACGDPFQLPPVDKTDAHNLLDNPHIFLDEIMRQAQESEIIQMSMLVREGKPLPLFKGKEVQVISKDELKNWIIAWYNFSKKYPDYRTKEVNQMI